MSTIKITDEKYTVEDEAGLNALPIGTQLKDIEGDVYLKLEDGSFEADSFTMSSWALESYLPGEILNPEILTTYEVGDIVEVTTTHFLGGQILPGQRGTIDEIHGPVLRVKFDDGLVFPFAGDEVRLIQRPAKQEEADPVAAFTEALEHWAKQLADVYAIPQMFIAGRTLQVGDRVRVNGTSNYTSPELREGAVGRIVNKRSHPLDQRFEVELETEDAFAGSQPWAYEPEHLDKIDDDIVASVAQLRALPDGSVVVRVEPRLGNRDVRVKVNDIWRVPGEEGRFNYSTEYLAGNAKLRLVYTPA
ncbi:hypothetical protein M2302_002264 [Micromonospora sp. A200]|uniref:hypothetical protein n=1 Tax=Micromonospora sp. A200 TaxID=2940568 RepID=UPI00247589CB|nr:hypothetical protein [Micromonospora sp. A200]MDH6462089.1 hypothetical protein [Micromonospora sp. A200]